MSEENNFNRTMMEIGYLGAFYGMANQAAKIFDFYQKTPHGRQTQIAALLGKTLVLIGCGDYQKAVDMLEKSLENEDEPPAEIKIFLALVYKKAKTRADRVQDLLGGLEGAISGAAADAAREIATG